MNGKENITVFAVFSSELRYMACDLEFFSLSVKNVDFFSNNFNRFGIDIIVEVRSIYVLDLLFKYFLYGACHV